MHQLILASQSPRRFELLQKLGFQCTVDTVKVSEIIDENLNLEDAIQALAKTKAQALLNQRKYSKGQGILVLSADTVVVHNRRILGKPENAGQAEEFLRLLSGSEHRVISGLSVYEVDSSQFFTDCDTTWIRFRNLSEREIQDYISSGEPFDKAGAYAIQGLAQNFVTERRGSWSNVVGLPTEKFMAMIQNHGWKIAQTE